MLNFSRSTFAFENKPRWLKLTWIDYIFKKRIWKQAMLARWCSACQIGLPNDAGQVQCADTTSSSQDDRSWWREVRRRWCEENREKQQTFTLLENSWMQLVSSPQSKQSFGVFLLWCPVERYILAFVSRYLCITLPSFFGWMPYIPNFCFLFRVNLASVK